MELREAATRTSVHTLADAVGVPLIPIGPGDTEFGPWARLAGPPQLVGNSP